MNEAISPSDEVLVQREDGVVTIVLNRPERRNAVTAVGWTRLHQALLEVDPARDRALVITGAGDHFCAGADLGDDASPTLHLDRVRVLSETCLTLVRLPVPTIARVDGVAVGAGLNLALACDFVLASDRARLSAIFVRRGLSPDFGGSWILPRLVGMHVAKRLVLLGEIVEAAEAVRLGLVSAAVPPDELEGRLQELLHQLTTVAPMALRLSKQLLNTSFETSLDQALASEDAAQAVNLTSHDAAEAARAFIDKREPGFHGR